MGAVEDKVRADVEALISEHPMGEALSEMALVLAAVLDSGASLQSGAAGLATAAVSRELRATLVELARLGVPDDDDLTDRLSTPVRNTQEPGAGDARAGGR